MENIKNCWIRAQTAHGAHEAALATKERIRTWANWATLVLAVLTTLSATLSGVWGEGHVIVLWITVVAAVLTTLSKSCEQVLARPEEMANHVTAMGKYRNLEDRLVTLSSRVLSHVESYTDLDYDGSDAEVLAWGEEIEATRQSFPAAEANHKKAAEDSFRGSDIQRAQQALVPLCQVRGREEKGLAQLDRTLASRKRLVRR